MTRKPDEWMPLHVRKYLGDTSHLTRDQHGAYFLLLMAYWMRGGPLPDDDGQLAAICKATRAEWKRLRAIMASFFTVADGFWSQGRAEKELASARAIVAARSEAGKAGAAKTWENHIKVDGKRMANASSSLRQSDGPLPQPIPKEEQETITSFVIGRGGKKSGDVTVQDPDERIARFQKTIAKAIGKDGWSIVAVAADPAAPDYERALAVCKSAAARIGKGWPRLWPAPHQ